VPAYSAGRRRQLRDRHRLRPHRHHDRRSRRDARPPGRAGDRAREAAVHSIHQMDKVA